MGADLVGVLFSAKPLYITKLTPSTTVVSPVLELLRSYGVNFFCSYFTSFSDSDLFKLQRVVLVCLKRQTKCQVMCPTKIFTDTKIVKSRNYEIWIWKVEVEVFFKAIALVWFVASFIFTTWTFGKIHRSVDLNLLQQVSVLSKQFMPKLTRYKHNNTVSLT